MMVPIPTKIAPNPMLIPTVRFFGYKPGKTTKKARPKASAINRRKELKYPTDGMCQKCQDGKRIIHRLILFKQNKILF